MQRMGRSRATLSAIPAACVDSMIASMSLYACGASSAMPLIDPLRIVIPCLPNSF